MAYNFKSIADVDMVEAPAETANVLIEEDGVIKKAPKTAVGGETPDLVISIDGNPYLNITSDKISFTEGSLDNVLAALSEKRIPIVKLRFFVETQSDYCYSASELMANVYRYGTLLYFSYIYPMAYDGTICNGHIRFNTAGVLEEHCRYSTISKKMG